jgi:hypothetical protein
MQERYTHNPSEVKKMNTEQLREAFAITNFYNQVKQHLFILIMIVWLLEALFLNNNFIRELRPFEIRFFSATKRDGNNKYWKKEVLKLMENLLN